MKHLCDTNFDVMDAFLQVHMSGVQPQINFDKCNLKIVLIFLFVGTMFCVFVC